MKTPRILTALVSCVVVTALSQTPQATDTPPTTAQSNPTQPSTAALTWQVTAQDEISTTRQANEYITNLATGVVSSKVHKVTEIGGGLNYVDPDGRLQRSQSLIELMPDGTAAALHGQTKAYFAQNLNTTGAVVIVNGTNVLKSRIIGLFYYDASSGSNVTLSTMKDSTGELLPPNQIVYRDSMSSIQADVLLTYENGFVESDLILLQRPKPPEAYFLNPATTRIEIWHEYTDTETPVHIPKVLWRETNEVVRASMVEPDLIDESLRWGRIFFPLGRSFLCDGTTRADTNSPAHITVVTTAPRTNAQLVAKRWVLLDDGNTLRTAMIESVPWAAVRPQLDQLPAGQRGAGIPKASERFYADSSQGAPAGNRGAQRNGATLRRDMRVRDAAARVAALPADTKSDGVRGLPLVRQLPKGFLKAAAEGQRSAKASQPIRAASIPYKSVGYKFDYIEVPAWWDYTFDSGTYHLSSEISFGGTVTINSGAYIKSDAAAYILIAGSLVCNSSSDYPAYLTSSDDNTLGLPIDGSSGVPTYSYYCPKMDIYYVSSPVTINGLSVRWGTVGVQFDTSGCGDITHAFSGSELICCQTGLSANNCNVTIGDYTNPCQECAVNTPLSTSGCGYFSGSLVHVDCDSDSDGFPDWWELQYFGHLGVPLYGDADGDGINNWMEYIQGRNPSVRGTNDVAGIIGLQVYTPLK